MSRILGETSLLLASTVFDGAVVGGLDLVCGACRHVPWKTTCSPLPWQNREWLLALQQRCFEYRPND